MQEEESPTTENPSVVEQQTTTEQMAATEQMTTTEQVPVEKKKEVAVVGKTYTVSNAQYKVTGKNTVTFVGLANFKSKQLVIPAKVKILGRKYKVTAVGKKACYGNSKITSIKVCGNVTKVGDEAFAKCAKLQNLTLGTGVKAIGKKALLDDSSLNKITIKSKKLKKIGKGAFRGLKKHPYIKIYAPKGMGEKYTKLINEAK